MTSGYGDAPLLTKLGIKEGITLALLQPPLGIFIDLPPGVVVKHQARGKADVVVAFFTERVNFERRLVPMGTMVYPAGGVWIAWPKRTSDVETDMTEHIIRQAAVPLGLVDNKICAINATWSALRFVWRRELR